MSRFICLHWMVKNTVYGMLVSIMDIKKLSKMKYKNVQQKNLFTFLKMEKIADNFRTQPKSYPWVLETLAEKILM